MQDSTNSEMKKALEALFSNELIPNDHPTFPSYNQNVARKLRIRDIASLMKNDYTTSKKGSLTQHTKNVHIL